ncbi:hypothetical protein [Halorussus halobius]|uniref:hypothetical protein n=1 Tax=Halorussus halobius TaxID=1710537 RepID=UPI001091F1E4|nr:hypothetical protein [Halorussus halobius]
MRVERSYRGISERLARHYLTNLGGRVRDADDGGDAQQPAVVADDWRATLSSEKVGVGPSLTLTEVTVVFEGDEAVLDDLVARFSRKAMRAGG